MDAIYGKLTEKAVEKAAQGGAKNNTGPIEDSPFKQLMQEMDVGQEMVDILGMGKEGAVQGAKLASISAEAIQLKPEALHVGPEGSKGLDKVVDLLGEVNKGQMQMDSLVNEILYSGKRFTPSELLAIQAHVFQFAQMTELTVKVAEHGIGSVKSVLNTQVQ